MGEIRNPIKKSSIEKKNKIWQNQGIPFGFWGLKGNEVEK